MDLRFGNFTHVSVISCGCICDTLQALHSSDKIRRQLCRSDSPTKITGFFFLKKKCFYGINLFIHVLFS